MRIGVDLGGTKIEAVALTPSGEMLARHRVPSPRDDYRNTIDAIAALVAETERLAGAKNATVGVGIPGAMSPQSHLFKSGNSTWLIGHAVDKDLSAALGRPVRVANDANCFTLSEATDGAATGAQTVFGVILGTGVGGGLVVRGRVLDGHNAIAGEWGHNPLPWADESERPGKLCYCGQRGCIETFLSGGGLADTYAAIAGKAVGAPEVQEAAENGDESAQKAVSLYENRLARALAHIVNIFDPDVIVLGGGVSKMAALYGSVPKLWSRWVFGREITTKLVENKHGDSSGVRGAAWLWPEDERN
jgi:fructokinase